MVTYKRKRFERFFTGGSGGVGKDYPGSACSLPGVGATPEEEAGCSVLVEGAEDEAKEEDVYDEERGGQRERWTGGHKVVAVPLTFHQILEGD